MLLVILFIISGVAAFIITSLVKVGGKDMALAIIDLNSSNS